MKKNKFVIRRGYIKAFLASFFLAFAYTLNYAYFAGRNPLFDLKFALQTGILFLVMFIPGVFVVRWHYKVMDNNKPKY